MIPVRRGLKVCLASLLERSSGLHIRHATNWFDSLHIRDMSVGINIQGIHYLHRRLTFTDVTNIIDDAVEDVVGWLYIFQCLSTVSIFAFAILCASSSRLRSRAVCNGVPTRGQI